MPELPEVQTIVTTLAPRIIGRRIGRVVHLRDDMLTPAGFDFRAAISGRTVAALTRRGKRIVFLLDNGDQFFIHLGMTGRLAVEPSDAPIQPHSHLILDVKERKELRFRDPRRFGEIRWLGRAPADAGLGPEPLTMQASVFAARLQRTKRPIKNALMNQTVVAGLGNIYVDESLFASGIHPLTRADRLSTAQVKLLTHAIKRILRRAIRHRGSTLRDYVDADGNQGGFQHLHSVYDRATLPCRACKAPIRRIVLGGRSTHFCPVCQRKSPSRHG